MKLFVVFLVMAMAIPAYAALPPAENNLRDVRAMVNFLREHPYVAANLNTIDIGNRLIMFNGGCFVYFQRVERELNPDRVGSQPVLQFYKSTCPLKNNIELGESERAYLTERLPNSKPYNSICPPGKELSEDEVAEKLDQSRYKFHSLHARYKRKIPNFEGNVVFRFDIMMYGRAANIQVVEDTLGNKKFIRDLIRILRLVKFPPCKQKLTGVMLPLIFISE